MDKKSAETEKLKEEFRKARKRMKESRDSEGYGADNTKERKAMFAAMRSEGRLNDKVHED
jgi:hypothetical protein